MRARKQPPSSLGRPLALAVLFALAAGAQQAPEQASNFPFYLQPPVVLASGSGAATSGQPPAATGKEPVEQAASLAVEQRSLNPVQLNRGFLKQFQPPPPPSAARAAASPPEAFVVGPNPARAAPAPVNPGQCLYERAYPAQALDECLARRPYASVGLAAYKNDELLVDKQGCTFMLTNGLFKSHQLARLQLLEPNSECLDGQRVGLALAVANVSLAYLWTLRCLNKADQMLDDSTMDGATLASQAICMGSSQSLGFAHMQLSNLNARVELAADVFKNWRVTNVSVAMQPPDARAEPQPLGQQGSHTAIRDFTFEALDGDELNWRYQRLFENWSRNKLHSNFVEQYRRFLWISVERCLAEGAQRLPVKLVDMFANAAS